jgi:hypothetical protein
MRIKLVVIFYFFISLESFSQGNFPAIYINGIDTFFVGEKKARYVNSNPNNNFLLSQTDTFKRNIVTYYSKKRDALIAYKIDTIAFGNMLLTFSDSSLASIDLTTLYYVKDFENDLLDIEKKMKFLRNYINKQIQQKGKKTKLNATPTFSHYGYKWKNGNDFIILNIQYNKPTSETISLSLYFSNKKLEDFVY